jgi:hypothetical protein
VNGVVDRLRKRNCVTLIDRPAIVTSTWMCVARPWYQPGWIVVKVTSPLLFVV